MKIPLDEFEEIIDEVILERGFSYFRNGNISDFKNISTGKYTAHVMGSEKYTVKLEVEDNSIIEYSCDCPYDMGPVCKHVVASIYYLDQSDLSLTEDGKVIPISQQFKELLEEVSYENLKEFMLEQSERDDRFRDLFLSNFAHLNDHRSKSFYKQQIKSIVNSATDRHGFIGWHEMRYLEQGVDPIIVLAEKQLENNNYIEAINICTTLMEEMTETIQFCDDSYGYVGGIIDTSFQILQNIAQEEIPVDVKRELFNYCIVTFKKRLFDGWDWHIGIMDIAFDLTENEKEADIVIECLEGEPEGYKGTQAQLLIYKIMTKYKAKEDTQIFINKNINNPEIRSLEIGHFVKNMNFEKAIKLCKDGIAHDKKDKPGLIKDWYYWLLKIAQSQKKSSEIIEYARFLLIGGMRQKEDYYAILKHEVEPDRWKDFLEDIIKEVTSGSRWGNLELVRNIFINEKWWDRLLLQLKEGASLSSIQSNEEYLAGSYSSELVKLYRAELIEYVAQNMGRKHYQMACRYLRRMKKLGGDIQAGELIEYFRKEYPQRRALMDELSRV